MSELKNRSRHPFQQNGDVFDTEKQSSAMNGVTVTRVAAPLDLLHLLDGHDILAAKRLRLEEEVGPRGLLSVRHQLTLGASPKVSLEWQAHPSWLGRSGRVLIFRNSSGFAPTFNAAPVDQINHGEQIVDSRANDYSEWPLSEGTTYFAALLASTTPMSVLSRSIAGVRRSFTGSPTRVGAFLRFSVTVPSNHVAIDRIKQQAELLESVERTAKAREKLGRRMNTTDRSFEVGRHASRAEAETDKRVSEFRAIQHTFKRHAAAIAADSTLSSSDKDTQRQELDALLRATLSAANFPHIDTRDAHQDGDEP